MQKPLILILACLFLFELRLCAEEESWEKAVELLKTNQFSEASENLNAWITQKASAGIYSSHAHYNLFLAQMGLEAEGPAVAHLLRSIQIERNPFKNLDSLNTLCDLQGKYGIKEGPCQNQSFMISLLIGRNFLTVLLCLFLWGLVFSCLLYFREKKALFKSTLLVTLLIGGGNLISYLNSKSSYSMSVLSGNEKNVPVFKTEKGIEEEKLVDLAPGTLVESSSEVKNGKIHITQPLAGWVEEENIILVDESLSKTPLTRFEK